MRSRPRPKISSRLAQAALFSWRIYVEVAENNVAVAWLDRVATSLVFAMNLKGRSVPRIREAITRIFGQSSLTLG